MSTEQNKAIARRYIEALDRGKGVVEEDFFAPNYRYYMPGSPDPLDSKTGEQLQTMSYLAFPDLHATIEDQIAEGDAVVTRGTWRGTHQGTFMGIPPTGKQVTISGIMIQRYAQGKLVEHRLCWLRGASVQK
jgi:predicted ester cyclase